MNFKLTKIMLMIVLNLLEVTHLQNYK